MSSVASCVGGPPSPAAVAPVSLSHAEAGKQHTDLGRGSHRCADVPTAGVLIWFKIEEMHREWRSLRREVELLKARLRGLGATGESMGRGEGVSNTGGEIMRSGESMRRGESLRQTALQEKKQTTYFKVDRMSDDSRIEKEEGKRNMQTSR
ncbi:hypothetical protein FN846DRAFT_908456 [Sphaerosporella brunnea]|uniref:Uncharacterized protein n=1 Tax=Sphaerosporella brunnea TaxID=1250544 RepID=A0A5J5ETH3_9PEZI|nr:hypothetical protein FN846DRAFT_908456 [Sphaerosporella brunnea]